jgi:rhodanese-related sulfurtransferase
MASGLLFLPDMKQKTQIPAETFLNDIHSNNRYLSTDEIAKRIIDGDPILFIVDVRTSEEYDIYSMPGAINIPLQDILKDDWAGYLDQNILDIIFYSDDDIDSEQAWALCKQLGYTNLYVLEGGLNHWFSTIMLPPKPADLAPSEDFDLFDFRTGASLYFGSGYQIIKTTVKPVAPKAKAPTVKKEKKKLPVKKKVKREAEGGC